MVLNWEDLKVLLDSGTFHWRHVELSNKYIVNAWDDKFTVKCSFFKNGSEALEYENAYKEQGSLQVNSIDSETGGIQFTPKFAPPGWKQQLFETEFETSTYGSVHEKNAENQDIGWSTLKFFKEDGNGNEVECIDAADAIANCVRTDLEWMPDIDYMIKGGWIGQITPPAVNVYAWAQAAVLPDAYGGPQITFAEGGLNLAYVPAQSRAGLDGVAGSILKYGHPQLGPGVGSNKLRFILRHPTGFKHRFQVIMDIFAG